MTISATGKIQFNDLAGAGDRFLQVDASGELRAWTGDVMNSEKVLYGDGVWRTTPITVSGANLRTPSSSKFGIGMVPTAELDVAGAGKVSGSFSTGGVINSGSDITLANGFKFSYQPAAAGMPKILSFSPNLTPGGSASYPTRPTKLPCNVWSTPTEFKDPNGLPFSTPWTPPTDNTFEDLLQVYESNAQKSVLSFGILNGDGVIALEPHSGNSNPQILKINPGCSSDVYIGEGGGNTKIFNSASVGTRLRVGPGTNITSGAQVDIFMTSTFNKAIIVSDASLSGSNKTVFEMSKSGNAIFGSNMQPLSGSMLSIGQGVKTSPGISLMDNSVSPNLPIFNVYGNGLTEIRGSSTKALSIYNASSSLETFLVNSNGSAEIKTNAAKAVSIKDASNSNNETFFINANGYVEIDIYAPGGLPDQTSGIGRVFAIKDKNQPKDIFVVKQNGKVYAREVEISLSTTFPDYVFNNDYKLKSFSELENFIKTNKHLPGFEKGEYYEKNGLNVNEMIIKQQEKIEELTLYILDLQKRLQAIEKK